MKKLLIPIFFVCLLFCFYISSFASDFIAPNSSGEPIIIDVSNLNTTSSIDVTIDNFTDQPKTYRDTTTKSLVVFPPPISSGEKIIQVRSGGSSISKTISFRSSPFGILKNSLLPPLVVAKGGHTVTKISDGRIVLIGGSKNLAEEPLDSLEVFDGEAGKSTSLKTPNELKNAKLKIPRSQHTATYLGISESPIGKIDGPVEQILVVGGFSKDGAIENSLEIVEIKVGSDQTVSTLLANKNSKLKKARIFHSASLLPDGKVLIVGGQGKISKTNVGALNSIEIFDPLTRAVQPVEISLATSRLLHTATTLQDGNILIAGGFTNEKQSDFGFGPATETAELINSKNLTIKKVGSLVNNEGIGGHTAVLLTNGLVLLAGGSSDFFSSRTKDAFKGLPRSTVQFYNTSNETFNVVTNKSTGGKLELETPRFLHEALLLPNGNVVIIGGLNIKAGLNSTSLISTPVSTIEILEPDLLTFSTSNSLQVDFKNKLETTLGRILPRAILVTPKNKTLGFLSQNDTNDFVNSVVYITGGFTNGLGKLPTKVSELLQIQSNNAIEGRKLKVTPEAIIQGSYLGGLLVELDEFSKVPSLKADPQTINLSSSNNFMANIKVLTSNNESILLKSQSNTSDSIIVSPSLFQVGETVSISRKDSSVQGEFEISFVPAESTRDFIEVKVKVNISDSAKPFLATTPGFGISLSNQQGANSDKVQLKVLSQDGQTEFSSIPPGTQVTAKIGDTKIANLGGIDISSVTGTLATPFIISGVKPGKTTLSFSINFPDVLGVSIPIEVSGAPTFSNAPIDPSISNGLALNGIEVSSTTRLTPTSVSLSDLRLSTNSPIFPIYVPVNLLSSVDNSSLVGSFTIRPIFGVDLLTAISRTTVNKTGTDFKSPLSNEPTSISGIVPKDISSKPIAILSSQGGLKSITYSQNTNEPITDPIKKISDIGNATDLKLFELNNKIKIVALKGGKISILDLEAGNEEGSASLSGGGFEQELTTINNQIASVVSVGEKGIDLIFPLTDTNPRVINFTLAGNTKNITAIDKLADKIGPFAIAYDGISNISIVNLQDINAPIKIIDTQKEKIKKIDYAGKFTINGMVTDVLCAVAQRKILLFDLNNLTSIPVTEDLKIKNQIEDLLVIDGIAYVALGQEGIEAVSIGSLINKTDNKKSMIANFKKNKLIFIKSNGSLSTKSKPLNAKNLADSKPFLLSSGPGNNLTVIRVSP